MNDGSSTFHIGIAGPVADIHKLSSWVVAVFFSFLFAIKYTALTMHNRSLEVHLICLLPLKKKKTKQNWI